MKTLGDILRRNARLYPRQLAVIDGATRRTHAEHYRRACALANSLGAIGIESQDRVAVLARNRVEFLDVYAACDIAGIISVGLNWRLAVPELARILDDCEPRVVFYESHFREAAHMLQSGPETRARFICFDDGSDDFEAMASGVADDRFEAAPGDIAGLIYTSGTTGLPKGVTLDHRGQLACAESIALETGAQPDDRLLSVMPLFHLGARCKALGYAYRGAAIIVHRAFDAGAVADAVEQGEVSALHLAPTMIQALVDEVDRRPSFHGSVRAIHYAAAPMPVPLLRRALQRFGPVFTQFYGMTESGALGTVLHRSRHLPDGPEAERARLASAGQPGIGCDIRIVRDDGTACAIGEVGEVQIRAPALMRGYWRNDKATADVLKAGWLSSGDVGYLDDEAFLFLVDRKKDMVVTGGENVYPREVEDALLTHPDVASAAVIGVPDEKWGEAVVAFVVRKRDSAVSEGELVEHTRRLIASYKKPKQISFVDSLPLLATGKVDKKSLRAPFWPMAGRAI